MEREIEFMDWISKNGLFKKDKLMSCECEKCGEHALECGCTKHIPNLTDKKYET